MQCRHSIKLVSCDLVLEVWGSGAVLSHFHL